jgi:hypothetical protein
MVKEDLADKIIVIYIPVNSAQVMIKRILYRETVL